MATTPSAAKPLPRLPNILPRAGAIERDLPPAAREHVRKIIAQCVADESLPTSWISLVHQVVEDIGRAVTDDNWLPGLCALKDARRKRVLESSDNVADNVTANNVPNESRDGRETPRHRHLSPLRHLGTPGSPNLSPRWLRAPKLRGAELLELNARALAELTRLVGDSQAMFSSLDMIHLVVTLVSAEADDPSLASSSTPRCIFVKNQFVLPTADDNVADGDRVLDLCGIESWKSLFRLYSQDQDRDIFQEISIVGGKVILDGATTAEKESVVKALRVGIYAQFSNLLELSFLQSSGAEIIYPPPPPSPPSVAPPPTPIAEAFPPEPQPSSADLLRATSRSSRKSRASGIWSFLSSTKKALDFRHSPPTGPSSHTTRPFVAALATKLHSPKRDAFGLALSVPPPALPITRAETQDAISRLAIGVSSGVKNPFTAAVKGIRADASIFSTSHSVRFDPPETLLRLASDEMDEESLSSSQATAPTSSSLSNAATSGPPSTSKTPPSNPNGTNAPKRNHRRRITGADKAALSSILGWRPDGGTTGAGRGFGGTSSFVKHQCITVLYSPPAQLDGKGTEHQHKHERATSPPPPPPAPTPAVVPNSTPAAAAGSSTATITATSSQAIPTGDSSKGDELPKVAKPPGPPRLGQWRTYRYYDEREPAASLTLGQWISEASYIAEVIAYRDRDRDRDSAGTGTEGEGDGGSVLEHAWMHLNFKLTARLEIDLSESSRTREKEKGKDWDPDEITLRHRCAVCGAETDARALGPGASLLDFGKFLELLYYSDDINRLSPPLCEHTTTSSTSTSNSHPTPSADSNTPPSEPRLNLIRHFSRGPVSTKFSMSRVHDIFDARLPRCQVTRSIAEVSRKEQMPPDHDEWLKAERDRLRLDMTFAWKGLKDRLRWLEGLNEDESSATSQITHKRLPTTPPFSESPEESITPRRKSSTAKLQTGISSSRRGTVSTSSSSSALASSTTISTTSTSTVSLSSLKDLITNAEIALYRQLAQSSLEDLGDIRRAFITSASDTYQRIQMSTPTGLASELPDILDTLPEWWKPRTHCLPNSSVVVREAEWGSIIAFTLRSSEYRAELQEMASGPTLSTAGLSGKGTKMSARTMRSRPSSPRRPSRPTISMRRSVSGPISSNMSTNGYSSGTAPDRVKEADEAMTRDVEDFSAVISRKENPRDVTSILSLREVLKHRRSFDASSSPSKIGTVVGSSKFGAGMSMPRGAWAKPDVQVSMQMAGGEVTASAGSSFPEYSTTTQASLFTRPSVLTRTVTDASTVSVETSHFVPSLPSQMPVASLVEKEPLPDGPKLVDEGTSAQPTTAQPNHLTSVFTSVIKHIIAPSSPKPEVISSYEDTMHRLALLGLDQAPSFPRIDSRPHLQYDFTVGNRLRFSCTSYYALQFSHLRKQCGVEETLMRSLERTTGWIAEGGKSKASFFKTADDRFILKTLVTAWHVSDLQVLLELAPSYFAYMAQTQDKPSTLAKLLGFYTIEVKNLETGATESKADVLVMENLFWSRKPDVVYDLKGIRGRKAKGDAPRRTMMDVEFMENQRHTPAYVGPRSKYVLQEALSSDAEFLANSNVMDYSLLLGLDYRNQQVICGLVDTFGTYTFAKTLESKAKHGLKSGREKEVTVVPPSEYQARFLKAIDRYLISIPDKWTKPSVNLTSSEFFRATQVL